MIHPEEAKFSFRSHFSSRNPALATQQWKNGSHVVQLSRMITYTKCGLGKDLGIFALIFWWKDEVEIKFYSALRFFFSSFRCWGTSTGWLAEPDRYTYSVHDFCYPLAFGAVAKSFKSLLNFMSLWDWLLEWGSNLLATLGGQDITAQLVWNRAYVEGLLVSSPELLIDSLDGLCEIEAGWMAGNGNGYGVIELFIYASRVSRDQAITLCCGLRPY